MSGDRVVRAGRATTVAGLVVALVVAACGGSATPSGAAATSSGSMPTSSNTAAPPPAGVTLVAFADTADPALAAERELALVRDVRDSAGMPSLLGEPGPAIFASLDAVEAESAATVLRDAATVVDTGTFPEGGRFDPLAGQLAAQDGLPPRARVAPGAIDISLFAETGFTTAALMSMFADLVGRAGDAQSGTISRSEPHTQAAGGLRQVIDLTTTMSLTTGGGRVTADLTLSATDNIFNDSTGAFVALYTSTSTGHFDVSACPDEQGHADGTYTFQTKHELNDVSATTAARSAGGRSVVAPFILVDGPDAHLTEIRATLDLQADARGPGTAGGPGPTSPFDWAASQVLQVVMPARGGVTSGSGGAATVTGAGGGAAGGAMTLSSAMAQLFLGQVGTEAEAFWRAGKCFEVITNAESRKVERNEQVDIEVSRVKHRFDPVDVDEPVTIRFTGKERLDPAAGTPLDLPANVTFVAGSEPRDNGTLDIEQISVRGIGRKTLEFEVQPEDLWITITGRLDEPGANLRLDTGEWKLEKTDRGFEQSITGDVSGSVDVLGCSKRVSDELALRVIAVVDEADRDLVRLFVAPSSPELDPEQEITCRGVTTRALIPTSDFSLPFLGADGSVTVRVGETVTLRDPGLPGVQVTVSLTRQETGT